MRQIILLGTIIVCICSCRERSPHSGAVATISSQYVSAFTTESIKKDDNIQVRMVHPVAIEKVGTELAQGAIRLVPPVRGKAVWSDVYTITYTPDEAFTYDEHYLVELDLNKVVTADKQLPISTFPIHVQPLRLTNQFYSPKYERDEAVLQGEISSSEPIAEAAIEQMLTLKYSGPGSPQIKWNHYSSKKHRYTVSGIMRSDRSSEVALSWNGKKYDKLFVGNRQVSIMAKGSFAITGHHAREDGSSIIEVYFSGELDPSQELAGLVTIRGQQTPKVDISGSSLTIYPAKPISGSFDLIIDKSVQRYDGKVLAVEKLVQMSFDPTPPMVAVAGKGVIVPSSKEVIFPFKAKNLQAVTVEVFKIYSDNVLQLLQTNNLDVNYEVNTVGNIIHQEHVSLADLNDEDNSTAYVRYALDLSRMTVLDPGALYQIRIGFDRTDVKDYPCKEANKVATAYKDKDGYVSIMKREYGPDYDYYKRDDPCHSSYYTRRRFISRNVLASNLGIITKVDGSHKAITTVTDLRNISPRSSAKVSYYDYQQQLIASSKTDSKGMNTDELTRRPSFVVVESDGEYGYMSLLDRSANSLSEFDVSGQQKGSGVDGFIYGERGVWRPGDTMYLNFMLEDKTDHLPLSHPVNMSVHDARGQLRYQHTTTLHTGRVYHFPVPTESDAATGRWRATVTVGNATFQQALSVETIKPNRIKVDYQEDYLDLSATETLSLEAKWLHGGAAAGLKATVDLTLQKQRTSFESYLNYTFDDPARKLDANTVQIFSGKLTKKGDQKITIPYNESWLPPGKVTAHVQTKVYEASGNFNTDSYTIPADPYSNYVGVRVPQDRWGSKYIEQANSDPIQLVLLDKNGKPQANKKLKVGLYHASWNWWYDRGYSDRYKFNSSTHLGAAHTVTLKTDASGRAEYMPDMEGYGNYMVRVCDESSGHCTGDFFYTGRYWDAETTDQQQGASQLVFDTDKDTYKIGEDIKIQVPSTVDSKLFISIENGSRVLQSFWVDANSALTELSIPTEVEMNANIYIHVHLVQPHNNGSNDLPLRMYGVVPVSVIDPASALDPIIHSADEVKPNGTYSIDVSERDGKPMTYTVAVVDEGLLSLTRYDTPSPWKYFYSKQSLGVKTWDVYDYVLSGYGGLVDKYISIGGDAGQLEIANTEVNRFEPVVQHLGPFTLAAGQRATHLLTMPNYVGAVRAMVVARHDETYGSSDKTLLVKQPLMVQATLPRIMGPGETLELNTTVWAMDDNIKKAQVEVTASELATLTQSSSKRLTYDRTGDQTVSFPIKVGDAVGPARFTTAVTSGAHTATDDIHILVRNPNPATTEVTSKVLQPGDNWVAEYAVFGTAGTNSASIEVSSIPPLNIGKRLGYLLRYPHGCLEQTTSKVFPQLYLEQVTDLDAEQVSKTRHNINAAISRLKRFQQTTGGFAYWIGSSSASDWGTSYAGHFLLEAKDKGYPVPSMMIDDFIKYQTSAANVHTSGDMMQAYRLYTLARAGEPNIGAMNRLRKTKDLSNTTKYLLAASYALIGQSGAADELLLSTSTEVQPYRETGYTYGSDLRDKAIIALALHKLGRTEEALTMVADISKYLDSNRWHSTHATAYALLAVGQILTDYEPDNLKFSYAASASRRTVDSQKSLYSQPLSVSENPQGTVSIKNESTTVLFAKVVLTGQRAVADEVPAVSKHINLRVKYTDMAGANIDPASLRQGTDFYVVATVTNPGSKVVDMEEVALTQVFPSGWEIINERLTGGSNNNVEYQDIRDDRINSFFDLRAKESITVKTKVTATYAGRFYLPPVVATAMYDDDVKATTKGRWVTVSKQL